ncbi:MAG: nucleotidyltransferase family protein [Burkholderiales bacterium]|jgi:molybdenum cofactor cytidylyltransferase|nr:nucleotidyltransferase family protein [Burkholderiales bacterium]
MRRVVGILLAGGAGIRFGSNKLLHPLADGTPIAAASARHLAGALPGAVAVIRPGSPTLAAVLAAEGMRVTVCPRAADGMGETLAHGVRAARDAGGWVVALGDMPFVRPETIRAVADRLASGAAIVAPRFQGQRGHPVGLSARYLAELEALGGDEGARAVLKRDAALIEFVDCDDPGITRDVDTPGDLEPA